MKQPKRAVSKRQDARVMSALGGRIQPASGAMPGYKSDGRIPGRYRIETKYTQADAYSMSIKDLWKIAGECEGLERPLFIIDYLEKSTHKLRGRYAVLPFADLEKMIHALADD